MAAIHGRFSRLYMGLADSDAEAEPVALVSTWSMSNTTDKAEVTALGDSNKTYVAGLPDSTGEFSGFYDDASVQTYTAAIDGLPRKMYLYTDTSETGTYWFGTILPDFSVNGSVSDSTQFSSTWSAASKVSKVTAA